MKIRIDLKAIDGAEAAHAVAAMADDLEGALLAVAEPLIELVDREDVRTDELCDAVWALEYGDVLEGEVNSAESDDGEVLEGSLEGELSFALEVAISSRREAKDNGNGLLDRTTWVIIPGKLKMRMK